MPSFEHETLVALFKNRPELAVVLVRDVLGVKLPAHLEAREGSIDLGDVEPAERYADCVVLLFQSRTGRTRRSRRPALAFIVEVQLYRFTRKRLVWPAYLTRLRADQECDVGLLIVTPDAKVADWARRPIELGFGSVVRPLVIGPKGVPVIRNVTEALAAPELGVLSAMAHGRGDVKAAVRIAVSTLRAAERRAAKHLEVYYDWIMSALGPAARKAFAKLPEGHQYRDRSLRRSFQKGEAEARAKDVLAVLEARGLSITREQRDRILETSQAKTLEAWIRRAATVTRAGQLFSERARRRSARRSSVRTAAR